MFIATVNQEAAKPGQRPQVDSPRKMSKINKIIREHRHSSPSQRRENEADLVQIQAPPQNEFSGNEGGCGLLAIKMPSEEKVIKPERTKRLTPKNSWTFRPLSQSFL